MLTQCLSAVNPFFFFFSTNKSSPVAAKIARWNRLAGNHSKCGWCCVFSSALSKSNICFLYIRLGRVKMSVLVQFNGRDKVYSADATSGRMYSTIALFFITRQGAPMVFPYNLAVSSLTCGFYPAVSCRHPFNNSQHRFCSTFQPPQTQTPSFCGFGGIFNSRFW